MGRIIIINDSYKLADTEGKVEVEKVADYVDTYAQIVAAIHRGEPLRVYVRDATCYQWLSRLCQQYGEEQIELQENSPREALKRQWRLKDLPVEVTDWDILESRLLQWDIVPREGESFQDVILENFYNRFFTYPELPTGRLVELLDELDMEQWQKNQKIALIHRQYEQRLDEWKVKTKNDEMATVIDGIRQDPQGLRLELMNFKLVRSYPGQVGERVLGKRYHLFRKLSLDLNGLRVERQSTTRAILEIEFFLQESSKITTVDDLEVLLEMISGELPVEFYAIQRAMQNHREFVTMAIVKRMKRKFSSIEGQIAGDMKRLEFILSPERPSEPDDTWDVEQWLQWAVREYLPYQFWLEEQNECDDEVASFSERFGNWLYENFISLKISFPRVLHKVIPNACHELRSSKGVSLFLVIDNFNFKYFNYLQVLLNKKGFFCGAIESYLSMIPSETDIAKKCLLSGEPERNILGNRGYDQIVEENWASFIEGKTFEYLPNLGALNEVCKAVHDVYFLNYRSIDEVLHEDEGELGRPHRDEVVHRLQILVEGLDSFAKRLGIEQQLSVYICSDHGSTKIQVTTTNTIDRKYYEAKSENHHHRFVTISDIQMHNLPSHVENHCYVIRKEEFGTLENYLIAKGYSRFVEINSSFYVHGGLSPEEIIVPFAVFRKVEAEPEDLVVHLADSTFRYSVKSIVILSIGNPNDYLVVGLEIFIRNGNVEAESTQVAQINPKNRVKIRIPARFRKTLDEKEANSLLVRIRYQFLGGEYVQDVELPITMKSMVQVKTDIDELF